MRAIDVVWALAATVPVSAAGLAAGAVLERAGGSAKVRERIWSLAYWLGPAAGVLALAAQALPRPAAVQFTVVLRGAPLAAVSQATRALSQAPPIPLPLSHGAQLPPVADLVLGVIALGLVFRLARLGRAWLALCRLRRDAVAAPDAVARLARAAGLKTGVPVRLSAAAPTPVAAGLFAPAVLLPQRFAAPEAATLIPLVCRHEAQHIARRDNLRLALEQLAAALYWFDPLRGALHRPLLAAREELCDTAALAASPPAERRLYARTLLEELTRPAAPILAAGLIGTGRSHAMTRIRAILDPRPARSRPALALGLCTALACVGGGAAYAANQAAAPLRTWASQAAAGVAKIRPLVQAAAPALAAGREPQPALPTPAAFAPAARSTEAGATVGDILVLGNHEVDVATILAALPFRRGQAVTPATLARAEQALRDTGLFDDVGVALKGGDLQVWVAEKRLSVRPVYAGGVLAEKLVRVGGAFISPATLHERIDALARSKGVQATQDNMLDLEAEVLHGLAEEQRRTRWGDADLSAGLPADFDGAPIAFTADHLERFDAARMTRFTGGVTITGNFGKALGGASIQANMPNVPPITHLLVADTVEIWQGPSDQVEAMIINGLRYAE